MISHCQRFGHVWRFETENGTHMRVCQECGARQLLLKVDGTAVWGSTDE